MEALPYQRERPFYVFHLLINITTLETPEIEISIRVNSLNPSSLLLPLQFLDDKQPLQ